VKEPRWLTGEVVAALHGESLARFGGAPGLRDKALLDSAIARPRQVFAYGETVDICALAAAYGCGIVRNHPFLDGNKRAGLLAIAVFLHLNDHRFDPDEAEEVRVIAGVAAGEIGEPELADWIRANATAYPRP